MFVLLQLGRCHIILSRILLFVTIRFLPRLFVLLAFFKCLDASSVSRISSKVCFRISSIAFFFMVLHISTYYGLWGYWSLSFLYASSSELDTAARWPLWTVVKLSSFLRTSPSPITSHFMLFSFSSSSSSCTCSSFSNVLTLYVSIFSRSPLVWWFFVTQRFLAPLYVVSAEPKYLLGLRNPCCWGLEALVYLYFACWFS